VTHEVGHRLGLGHTGGIMDADTNLEGTDAANRYTLDQQDNIRDIPADRPE
jgi:predicted Zn-dependent protease